MHDWVFGKTQDNLDIYFWSTRFLSWQCSLLSLAGKVKEEHVSLLMNAGLLVNNAIFTLKLYSLDGPMPGVVKDGLLQRMQYLLLGFSLYIFFCVLVYLVGWLLWSIFVTRCSFKQWLAAVSKKKKKKAVACRHNHAVHLVLFPLIFLLFDT